MALAKNDQIRFENTEIIKSVSRADKTKFFQPISYFIVINCWKTGKLKVLLLWLVQRVSVI